jgi:hypothetical protein
VFAIELRGQPVVRVGGLEQRQGLYARVVIERVGGGRDEPPTEAVADEVDLELG